jgi:hypothetical protein
MVRRKWIFLVAAIVLVAVGAELAVRWWNGSRGCVQVINEGDGPIDDLVVIYSATRVDLGRLGPGLSAKAWFSPAGRGTLTLEFKQNNNPLKGFKIQDFDPVENHRTGSKLVLVVKLNRIERFMEEDESSMEVDNLADRMREWIRPRL